MRQALTWIWDRGIVSTFLAGLLVILPLAITGWIMGWAAGALRDLVGPGSAVGEALRAIGLRFVANDVAATLIGWAFVVAAIWLLGLFVKSTARFRLIDGLNRAIGRVPVVRTVYGPVSQVVSMLRQPGREEMKAMTVVYCSFGQPPGAGFLALLASEGPFRFGGDDCQLVYIPTSPLPMTGGLLFVPAASVRKVDMTIEALMQVYFSMGVMAANAIPPDHVAPPAPPLTATPWPREPPLPPAPPPPTAG